MEDKEIEIYVKQVWGTTRVYFVNDEMSQAWWSMTLRKTITRADMLLLKKYFGVSFKEVPMLPTIEM
jgi:hypothetical protein